MREVREGAIKGHKISNAETPIFIYTSHKTGSVLQSLYASLLYTTIVYLHLLEKDLEWVQGYSN